MQNRKYNGLILNASRNPDQKKKLNIRSKHVHQQTYISHYFNYGNVYYTHNKECLWGKEKLLTVACDIVRIPFLTVHFLLCQTFLSLNINLKM